MSLGEKENDSLYEWLAIYLSPGIGSAGCLRLVEHFGSPQAVLAASSKELRNFHGLKKDALDRLAAGPASKQAEEEINRAAKRGAKIITYDSPSYPERLRTIYNPPVILYLLGDSSFLHHTELLAIVGSRAATNYGLRNAELLSRSLSIHGFGIVSGLASGVDAAAHRGALSAGGKTLAVLGCGLDRVYPEQNKKLYQQIAQSGLLITEYPYGTKPDSFRFPARNRIISGLSKGVVVVEASPRSGSLITAKHALDQGREVFALPGRIDSIKSGGPHRLIQDGAKLVTRVEDILEEFLHFDHERSTVSAEESQSSFQLTDKEEMIISHLDIYPVTIDELIQQTGLTPNIVSETLLHMELKGIIESLPGKQFKRCAP